MKLSDLKPAPYNPREIADDALAALSQSVESFGDLSGIIWNKRSGLLVCGHQRLEALKQRGAEFKAGAFILNKARFPVRVVDWDETTERAANVTANNPHVAGDWTAGLSDVLEGLKDDLPNFEGLNLDKLLADAPQEAPEIVEDEVPEPPIDPITKPGDLWILGRHRLLCGDATKAEDVGRVMDGEKAALCFTSPPYDQQRDYGDASDCSDWDGLMTGVFACLPMSADGQVLVNIGLIHQDCEWVPYWEKWIEWMRGQGWRRFGWYVWDQGHGLRGDWHGRMAPSHEWLFHFNRNAVTPEKWIECKCAGEKGGVLRNPDGGFNEASSPIVQAHKIPDSVWRVERAKGGVQGHPAPFGVELPAVALRSWGGDVYDPFLGSGTTLIAAEQLDRRCFCLEIEPKYCDVVVERWQNLTGEKAVLEPV